MCGMGRRSWHSDICVVLLIPKREAKDGVYHAQKYCLCSDCQIELPPSVAIGSVEAEGRGRRLVLIQSEMLYGLMSFNVPR